MKVLMTAMLVLLFALFLPAQIANRQQESGLTIIKFSWSKERIGWDRDPFGGPIENFDEMRARTRNEKRIDDSKRGGGVDVDRIKSEARIDAAIQQETRQQRPPRYRFLYRVSLRNTGTKTIRAIHWDYVFFDVQTESELGRREFTSEEKINPGKTAELRFLIPTPPTQTISASALNNKERTGLGEKIVIVGVEYLDGSVWKAP